MPDYIFNHNNKQNEENNTRNDTNENQITSTNRNPMQQDVQFPRARSNYTQVPDKETFNPVYITPRAAEPEAATPQQGDASHMPRRPKKKRANAAVAILCCACVVLSGLAGFGGTILANKVNGGTGISSVNNPNGTQSSSYSENDAGVIYRSVATNTGLNGTSSETGTVSSVAAAVENSVVEIITEYQNMSSFFQYVTEGAGSGVIITSDGYIVTNNHVITGSSNSIADKITVRLKNGDEYEATVIGADSSSDIALLKIEATNLTPAIFGDSTSLTVGQDVVAVGNPLGELGGTVTNGIISALDREIEVDGTKMNLLQTNAAVNPGNSGGGLFNMNGELIGIVNAKSSGSGIEGLGFAIPANDALAIVEQLKDYGYVRGRVYLGLSFQDITDQMTAYYYNFNTYGVYVMATEEGYNDDVLQPGDRVTAVNGQEVTSFSDIKSMLTEFKVGDKVTFTISRKGQMMDVEVTCYESIPDGVKEVAFDS